MKETRTLRVLSKFSAVVHREKKHCDGKVLKESILTSMNANMAGHMERFEMFIYIPSFCNMLAKLHDFVILSTGK